MNLAPFAPYLSIAEIILAVVITGLVILQSKGSDMSGLLGGSSDNFGTKRGVDATVHNLTKYFALAFFIVTFLTFIAWGSA